MTMDELKDDMYGFVNMAINIASNSYAAWESLIIKPGFISLYLYFSFSVYVPFYLLFLIYLLEVKDKAFRLDPLLDKEYALDDIHQIANLVSIVEKSIHFTYNSTH